MYYNLTSKRSDVYRLHLSVEFFLRLIKQKPIKISYMLYVQCTRNVYYIFFIPLTLLLIKIVDLHLTRAFSLLEKSDCIRQCSNLNFWVIETFTRQLWSVHFYFILFYSFSAGSRENQFEFSNKMLHIFLRYKVYYSSLHAKHKTLFVYKFCFNSFHDMFNIFFKLRIHDNSHH